MYGGTEGIAGIRDLASVLDTHLVHHKNYWVSLDKTRRGSFTGGEGTQTHPFLSVPTRKRNLDSRPQAAKGNPDCLRAAKERSQGQDGRTNKGNA